VWQQLAASSIAPHVQPASPKTEVEATRLPQMCLVIPTPEVATNTNAARNMENRDFTELRYACY